MKELKGSTVTLHNENGEKYKVIHIYEEDGRHIKRQKMLLLQSLENPVREENKENGEVEVIEHYRTKSVNIKEVRAILYIHSRILR